MSLLNKDHIQKMGGFFIHTDDWETEGMLDVVDNMMERLHLSICLFVMRD